MAKKKRRTRLLFILLGGLLLAVAAIAGAVAIVGNIGGNLTMVETATVDVRTITQVVTASGRVQPEIEVSISPDVSGEIIALPVIEGQQVRKGQLLARIKPDFYLAQEEQADATVLQARSFEAQRHADMLQAEQDLKRQQSLYERQVISESAFEQARTAHEISKSALEAAEYQVRSAEAGLREAKEQLSKTILYAPMDGTVSKLNVELGERVVGTTQMAGTEMMIVARLDQMELEVEVNENDVVNVALSDSAAIEIDAYPNRIFQGIITEIANSARLLGQGGQDQVTNFPVKIRITDIHNVKARLDEKTTTAALSLTDENPAAENLPSFRPGMSGTVDIFTHTVQNVVAVPIQAVTVRDFNRLRSQNENGEAADSAGAATNNFAQGEDLRRVVFLMNEESKTQIVEVETGIADDQFMEVLSGLVGGERVIIGPYSAVSRILRADMPVQERKSGLNELPRSDNS